MVGLARGVQEWEPGIPSYCKVLDTDSAAVVVRIGHPMSNVIAHNVRDDRFGALFIHSPPPDPLPKPVDNPLPLPDPIDDETPVRGVMLAHANIGQVSVGQNNQLTSALRPRNIAGLFPEDIKRDLGCAVIANYPE